MYESEQQVSVVLANQVKYFARSLNLHSKTDELDASIIAQLGIVRTLSIWSPMFSNYKVLKALNRKRLGMIKQKNRAQNQLHALKYAHQTPATAMDITRRRQIEFYEDAIAELEQEIDRLVRADETLNEKVNKVATIKGVGPATVLTILCETNGFHLIRNIRQLVSYAGLVIVFNESGQSQGKTAISKRGNTYIRACLYMPALCAKRHEQNWTRV
ncbi:transposase [Membranihabitans maritimus]|uniref:transposase n=1 Tax=Membranihabitans maritimus TaxID=2904244 RepID=UPI0021050DF3|nr:transposase [Membranihabitans maritimus]